MFALSTAGAANVASQGEVQVDTTQLAALELNSTVNKLRNDYAAISSSLSTLTITMASRADFSQWTSEQLLYFLDQLNAAETSVTPLRASLDIAIANSEALAENADAIAAGAAAQAAATDAVLATQVYPNPNPDPTVHASYVKCSSSFLPLRSSSNMETSARERTRAREQEKGGEFEKRARKPPVPVRFGSFACSQTKRVGSMCLQ